MKQGLFEAASNEKLAKDIYQMTLHGDTGAVSAPGQFVNVKLDGLFLRRPISVCDWDEETLTLIYKVVGEGTGLLAEMRPGQRLDLLTGLGNGYDLAKSGPNPLLIGGGVGVPPLYGLCRRLVAQGKQPAVILGFNTKDEVFYVEEFQKLGAAVCLTTVDGSLGQKGFVTDAMQKLEYSYFYTCGPMPMLRAVENAAKTSGQYSFEARMACGFGACMGCSIQTKNGYKRICKEGPVLEREELLWQN